jgi:hypothetical protein
MIESPELKSQRSFKKTIKRSYKKEKDPKLQLDFSHFFQRYQKNKPLMIALVVLLVRGFEVARFF